MCCLLSIENSNPVYVLDSPMFAYVEIKMQYLCLFLSYFVPDPTLKNILVLPNVTYTEED